VDSAGGLTDEDDSFRESLPFELRAVREVPAELTCDYRVGGADPSQAFPAQEMIMSQLARPVFCPGGSGIAWDIPDPSRRASCAFAFAAPRRNRRSVLKLTTARPDLGFCVSGIAPDGYIVSVDPEGGARDAGLIDGDVIVSLDGLSLAEFDSTVQRFSYAITDFLGGLNACHGIVASRFYRSPVQLGWRKFTILPLTKQRQNLLIRNSRLAHRQVLKLKGELTLASDDILAMAQSPLLLGLLCEHVRAGNPFPSTIHEVFEKYLDDRFTRDRDRIKRRFGVTPDEARRIAEWTALA
jgi:hypothetical protein